MPRCLTFFAVALMLAGTLSRAGCAADQPVKLPPELAEALSAAQDDLRNGQARSAIGRLKGYEGDDHALRHLLLGHACVKLPDEAAAMREYEQALAMDATLAPAGIALAQIHARREHWQKSAELLGKFLNADACAADALLLYAQIAQRLEDRRLCGLLTRKGIVRFPVDGRFRRLDLALLLDEDNQPEARRVLRRLLEKAPADAALWQQFAATHTGAGDDAGRLAALEAGVMCDPGDLAMHRQLLAARLAIGDWPSAIRHGKTLLSGPNATAAAGDTALLDLLVRASDAGEKDDLLGRWLGMVATADRTRAMHLAAARRELRAGRTADARNALGRLIEAGETDPSVFLWAGHLAETAGDTPEAETLYGQARKMSGGSARLATLYLARLMLRAERSGQSARLLSQYLDAHPEDSAARALLALAEARE